jgi:hypothetical protein
LKEGLEHDDAWVMVEDEFYAIAQTFTQHLHYAEYVRRKKEAKAQSSAEIDAIERPTDGQTPMPKELQQKKEAEARAARQKAGLDNVIGQGDKNDTDDDDDDDDSWAGTHLYGLMTSPSKSRSLLGTHTLKSSTRAAAGFGQAFESQGDPKQMGRGSQCTQLPRSAELHRVEIDEATASSEDDDLDGQACTSRMQPRREKSGASGRSSATSPLSTVRRPTFIDTTSTLDKVESRPARPSTQPKHNFKSKVQMLFDDLDELPEPSRSNSSIPDKKSRPPSAAQKPEGAPEHNLESKNSRYKDVPTFLL